MKKIYKLMSILLVICFCISYLVPISTVQAASANIYTLEKDIGIEDHNEQSDITLENPADQGGSEISGLSEKPEVSEYPTMPEKSDTLVNLENPEGMEKVKTIPAEKLQERYNIQLQNPERDEYIEKISKITKFSEASKEELDFIAKYQNIDYTLLTEAEKRGYSIADSLLVAKIQTNASLTFEEIEKALLKYGDLQTLYTETSKYKNLIKRCNFSLKTADEIKNYLLEGYDVHDLEKPAVIAEIFNVDLHNVVKEGNEGNQIWNEIQKKYSPIEFAEFVNFIYENNINIKWYLDYTERVNIDWTQFYQKVKDYYDKALEEVDIEDKKEDKNIQQKPISVTSDEETEYKAPFSYLEYSEDRIEMNTGSLIHENVDVYLPGRNGLDFTLISRYDSGKHECGEKEYSKSKKTVTKYTVVIRYERYIYGGEFAGTHVEDGDFEKITDI